METKYVKVPFDIELAKKITNNEVKGRITTRNERKVRIVCWDKKDTNFPIIALIENNHDSEDTTFFLVNGRYYYREESPYDLVLEIPEYMTFNYGDVFNR